MRDRAHLLVEAGTGVGKSFAYLVPALLRIIEHNERVVVSTHTIALQEQLVRKDIPLLMEVLRDLGHGTDDDTHPPVRAELVKGRGNYLSIRRLERASRKQDTLFPDEASRRSLHQIEDWAYRTDDGSLATLTPLERPAVWDRVQSDSGNCMGRKCPRYEQCFFQNARKRAERAELLVCNHALFFADLNLRAQNAGFLPKYDHVILDEAHTVEDVASEHFGISLAEGRVMHLLGVLLNRRTGKGALATPIDLDTDNAQSADSMLRAAQRAAAQAEEAARVFFEGVIALCGRTKGDDASTVRFRRANALGNPLTPAFNTLAGRLKHLKDAAKRDEDRFELNSYIARAASIAAEAEALVEQTPDGCAFWAEVRRSRAGVRATLACSPIEVAPVLANTLFAAENSVTLASATLTTRPGEFAPAAGKLGCEDAASLAVGSPFDYAQQARVVVDPDMPDPRAHNYLDRLCDAVEHHVRESDGGAFILFTSFATLAACARRLAPVFERAEMGVFTQTQGASRTELLESFRAGERNVLFGTASFWQGVDVQGRALRTVVMTRLPFDPPDRPIVEARAELIEARGGRAFFDDSLPRAVMRFRQGFGRLIRSATDHGAVVVLDPRIVTKSYGRVFLNALPEGTPVLHASSGELLNAPADQCA